MTFYFICNSVKSGDRTVWRCDYRWQGSRSSLVYLVVGIADFIYQKYRFNEEMKMTKQEVKDEYKNTEGNPEVKGRQRQRMREARGAV